MVKSPLRYPGGKSRAIEIIAPLIPKFEEYREPLVGGGSLFFFLKQKHPTKKFWINDLYLPLFKFWEMCQKDFEGVIEQVWNWRRKFSEGKELHRFLLSNPEQFNDVERASAFFILNRITFSGTSDSGGYSEQAFAGRFTESSIQRLHSLKFILSETKITNLDFQSVVEADGENIFIFLDPPYYSATKSALYGKNGNLHKNFDHARFAETMKNCKHKWLITYDDSEYVRSLFSFANITGWDLTYGMRNQTPTSNQIGKELFISNYPISLQKTNQMKIFSEPKEKYKKKSNRIIS